MFAGREEPCEGGHPGAGQLGLGQVRPVRGQVLRALQRRPQGRGDALPRHLQEDRGHGFRGGRGHGGRVHREGESVSDGAIWKLNLGKHHLGKDQKRKGEVLFVLSHIVKHQNQIISSFLIYDNIVCLSVVTIKQIFSYIWWRFLFFMKDYW